MGCNEADTASDIALGSSDERRVRVTRSGSAIESETQGRGKSQSGVSARLSVSPRHSANHRPPRMTRISVMATPRSVSLR
jgi:hypothetical protein